jgi:hypothetical protein
MKKDSMDTPDIAWKRFRYRKRILWSGLFLYLPVTGSVGIVLTKVGLSVGAAAFAIAWMMLWTINGYQLSRFRCPKCKKFFFMQSQGYISVGNVWSTNCCHCGAKAPTQRVPA